MTTQSPERGNWYKRPGGDLFEIVAIDEAADTIEIQFYDGTVDEIDRDVWNQLYIEAAVPPEDWSGSMDIERDDYGVERDETQTKGYGSHLDYFDETD